MSSVTDGMRRRTEKKKSASVDCSRRNSLMDRSERSLRTVRLARLEFPQNRKHQIRTTLTLKNGVKRIEHEMKQLDAESLSTKRKISKMVHVLESGMDQLIEKMMRRKFELMDELQQIGDDERDRIVQERKSLQKRLVSMQKVGVHYTAFGNGCRRDPHFTVLAFYGFKVLTFYSFTSWDEFHSNSYRV